MLSDFAYPDRQRLIRPSLLNRLFAFLTTIPDFGDQPMTTTGITTTPMTFTTGDGRKFTDEADAKAHQALVEKIDRFMEAEGIADGSRRVTRERIVKWLDFDAATKGDEEREAA